MATLINSPFPIFTDTDGLPLENGYIDIGVAGLNPLANPRQAYWDEALTMPAFNIRTTRGYPSRNGAAGFLYTAPGDFSILVRNKNGVVILSNLNVIDQITVLQNSITLPQLFPPTLTSGEKEQVLTALDFIYYNRLYGKQIGEYFHRQSRQAITAWNPATPETFFPAVEVTEAAQVFNVANYPDYVPYLRAIAIEVGGTATFTGVAAAAIITLDNNAANNALLAALAEDTLFHGGYVDWRTITWDNTDYPITLVNAVTREITVVGAPTAGAGTATLYSYRIAGSTTTARLHKADGLVLATAGASGRVAGLRTRDAIQGHRHEYKVRNTGYTSGGSGNTSATHTSDGMVSFTGRVLSPITDNTNGTPRTDANTKDRSLPGYLYVHVGRYIAP